MPNKHSIELRQPILNYLRGVADERNRQDRERGCKHRPGIHNDNAQRKGVMGEFVYCAWAGIDYTQHEFIDGNFADDDDINGVQIRSTTHSTGHLVTYDRDKPAPYVLVTLDKVNDDLIIGTLRGWAWLNETRLGSHYRALYDCYFTPQSALHPMDTLNIKYN